MNVKQMLKFVVVIAVVCYGKFRRIHWGGEPLNLRDVLRPSVPFEDMKLPAVKTQNVIWYFIS